MRLIDADALKEIYSGSGTFTSAHFRTAIDEMPTIEPERKKGKWIEKGIYIFVCLNCGCHAKEPLNYCPCCGAEMEEEE